MSSYGNLPIEPEQPDEAAQEAWPPSVETLVMTEAELKTSRLAPDCIVEHMLYADLAQLVAAGGTGKTTMLLLWMIHIVLGRPLYGNRIHKSGLCVFFTAEDRREICVARIRELMDAMELSEQERHTVMHKVLIVDVVGESRSLIFSDEYNNLMETPTAGQIIEAFRDKDVVLMAFDPMVSFGASEERVNESGNALATVCRRIVRELNVCVLLIHHTGQAAARAKTKDAYTGRGGTAFADAARMVLVLNKWEPGDSTPPPVTLERKPDRPVLVLSQPKLSYERLPTDVWMVRDGYRFNAVRELPDTQTPQQKLMSLADQLERFLVSELKNGRRHTKTSIESSQLEVISMSKREFRAAVGELETSGRVVDRKLPPDEMQGGRKTYLHPAVFQKQGGGVGGK